MDNPTRSLNLKNLDLDTSRNRASAALRVLGFALFRAWPFAFFFIPFLTLGAQGENLLSLNYSASTLVLGITLVGFAFFPNKVLRLACGPKAVFLSTGLMAAGTFLLYVLANSPTDGMGEPGGMNGLVIVSALLTGTGSAVVNILWAKLYGSLKIASIFVEVPLSVFLSSVLSTLLSLVPAKFALAIVVVLPLASGGLLELSLRRRRSSRPYKPVPIDVKALGTRMGLAIFIIGFIGGCTHLFAMTPTAMPLLSQIPLLASNAITALITFAAFFILKRRSISSLFKTTILLLAFSVLWIPTFSHFGLLESTVTTIGFSSFCMLMWIVLCQIVKKNHVNPVVVFGLGWGAVTLGDMAGNSFGLFFGLVSLGHQGLSVFTAISITLILCTMLFMISDQSIMELIEKAEKVAFLNIESATGAGSERYPSFQEYCAEVARTYKLTPRETEIMHLMAKGYSGARIEERLVLTRSTVSTHQQNIYRKMSIHGRQELLDIIDEYHNPPAEEA